jgi:hypothetical protein
MHSRVRDTSAAIVDQTGAVILTENQLSTVLKNAFDEESILEAISSLLEAHGS